MKQRMCSLFLALVLLLSLAVPAAAAGTLPFTDVKESDWFYSYVKTMYDNELVSGTTPTTFSPQDTVTLGEALKFILNAAGYTAPTTSGKNWASGYYQLAQEKGYVETIFHRKRFLPDINSRNAVVRGYAERNAINAPIQGSAADIIKVAMARIYQRFQTEGIQAKMILQVHDELNFSVPVNEKERVEEIVIEEMEKAYRMHVPLKADCGWGKNWLEAH